VGGSHDYPRPPLLQPACICIGGDIGPVYGDEDRHAANARGDHEKNKVRREEMAINDVDVLPANQTAQMKKDYWQVECQQRKAQESVVANNSGHRKMECWPSPGVVLLDDGQAG